MTVDLGYQGSASRKMVRLVNQRFIFANDPNTFLRVGRFLPDAGWNRELQRHARDALAPVLSRRPIYRQLRWSKSIDIVSSDEVGAPTNPTFPLDVRQERGPPTMTLRHYFVASALYDLPIFRNRKEALGAILGGWQVSTIATSTRDFRGRL